MDAHRVQAVAVRRQVLDDDVRRSSGHLYASVTATTPPLSRIVAFGPT